MLHVKAFAFSSGVSVCFSCDLVSVCCHFLDSSTACFESACFRSLLIFCGFFYFFCLCYRGDSASSWCCATVQHFLSGFRLHITGHPLPPTPLPRNTAQGNHVQCMLIWFLCFHGDWCVSRCHDLSLSQSGVYVVWCCTVI